MIGCKILVNIYCIIIGGHLGRDKTIHKNDKFSKPPTKLRPIPIESEIWHQVWSQVKNYMLL